MSERAYTPTELNHLRFVVEMKLLYGVYSIKNENFDPLRWRRSWSPADLVVAVEQRVRTHMAAGHTAESLLTTEKADPQ